MIESMLNLPWFTDHGFPFNLGNSVFLPVLHDLAIETTRAKQAFQYPFIRLEAIGGDQHSAIRNAFMKGSSEEFLYVLIIPLAHSSRRPEAGADFDDSHDPRLVLSWPNKCFDLIGLRLPECISAKMFILKATASCSCPFQPAKSCIP